MESLGKNGNNCSGRLFSSATPWFHSSERITADQVTAVLSRIADLPVTAEIPSARSAFTQILPLARECGIASYDAAYLELAIRHAIPIAILDDSLRRAAKANGVNLA